MVSKSDGPANVATPTWTVAAVARRVGVAPATLRSWSRRYGIGPAEHEAGRYRQYTDADLAELETIRRLTADGMVLSSAAALARHQHRGPPERPSPADRGRGEPERDVTGGEVNALVQAAQRLDADTLVHTLEDSLARRGATATWNQLCRPGLTALDGPSGAACMDGALALAWAATTSLRRRFPAAPAATGPLGPQSGRVLLACAAAEHHTLALDALLTALTEHDVPAQVLGPALPTSALLHAAEHTRPRAVLVWAQRAATAHPSVLARLLPHVAVVAAAGPGWSTSRLPSGAGWVNTLEDALLLARQAPDPLAPSRDATATR